MRFRKLAAITLTGFASATLFFACVRPTTKKVQGFVPIYSSNNVVSLEAVRPYSMPGKIMLQGDYTFQIDYGSGIHIIESTDMANAKKIGFISVPAITEMHMQNDVIFADNGKDLVSILIGGGVENFKVLDRITNFFPNKGLSAPAGSGTYFECVDSTKGTVIGWEKKELTNPKCKTI
jgi:hypothetical protein